MIQENTARPIWITTHDMHRLKKLIEDIPPRDLRKRAELKDLEAELDRAIVVPDREVPVDVITMNSEALLVDLDSGEELVCKLVFPGQADITRMQVSVLAPVGTAMLGYRRGDTFEWEVPAGRGRFLVRQVLRQPETVAADNSERADGPARRADDEEEYRSGATRNANTAAATFTPAATTSGGSARAAAASGGSTVYS